MMRSMYLGLAERMAVWGSWMRCLKTYALQRQTYPNVLDGYVAGALPTWCLPNVDLIALTGEYYVLQFQVVLDRSKEIILNCKVFRL
jgi:hypothetical protein